MHFRVSETISVVRNNKIRMYFFDKFSSCPFVFPFCFKKTGKMKKHFESKISGIVSIVHRIGRKLFILKLWKFISENCKRLIISTNDWFLIVCQQLSDNGNASCGMAESPVKRSYQDNSLIICLLCIQKKVYF